jgi:hypothetical protein
LLSFQSIPPQILSDLGMFTSLGPVAYSHVYW